MAEPHLYWVVPCSRCSSPIALDVYRADEQLTSVPEEFSAWCMICGAEEKCLKSRIEKRLLPSPAPEFKPNSAFARRNTGGKRPKGRGLEVVDSRAANHAATFVSSRSPGRVSKPCHGLATAATTRKPSTPLRKSSIRDRCGA